jgi:hypothetical protein
MFAVITEEFWDKYELLADKTPTQQDTYDASELLKELQEKEKLLDALIKRKKYTKRQAAHLRNAKLKLANQKAAEMQRLSDCYRNALIISCNEDEDDIHDAISQSLTSIKDGTAYAA